MNPVFETISEKKLIGQRLKMSLSGNKTADLWRKFMPERDKIENRVGYDLISMQIYPDSYFSEFNPDTEFEKWAAAEVSDYGIIPDGMETYTIPAGLYAVFHYKGDPREGAKIFEYIFSTWLPASGYMLDNRPHFEVLGDKYKNNNPESEEEIKIPVKLKSR